MTDEKTATCQKCGYEWTPHVDEPRQCPKCKADFEEGETACKITFHCNQCGHKWQPRKKRPKACPSCKRYDWDEESKKAAQ